MGDDIVDEVEVTIKFERVIEDGADVNEAGKDHLESEIVDIQGQDSISVPLHHHIEEEIGMKPLENGIGHYKIIAKWD